MSNNLKLGTSELLFRAAEKMGLQPSWLTFKGPFVVTIAGEEQYINFARSPLNSQVSASLAKDKYMTRLILERNGLPNIPFARPRTHAEAQLFLAKHKKIIAKPVNGSGARDINIITTDAQLLQLKITDYILEQYISGVEMRYLVLKDDVVGVHRSDYGVSVQATRALQRISFARKDWKPALVEMSRHITDTLGLKFAAVDYLIDDLGRVHVLEVNTAPGFKWFHAPSIGPSVDVARLFLEAIVQDQAPNDDPIASQPLVIQPVAA